MPRSKNIAHYPQQFFDIITVAEKGETVEVNFETVKKAELLRFKFYAFTRALREAGHELDTERAASVQVLLHKNINGTGTLVFQHRDFDPLFEPLDAVLAKFGIHHVPGARPPEGTSLPGGTYKPPNAREAENPAHSLPGLESSEDDGPSAVEDKVHSLFGNDV